MSNDLITQVYQRKVGSLTRKAVLALFADKANDDGTGIWASKQRMADELGTTRQTIITTIKSLIDDGLIREVGQRKCANGFTVEYTIAIKALLAIPLIEHHQSSSLTSKAPLPVKQDDATRKAPLPKPSGTLRKEREKSACALPDDWEPIEFGIGTKSRAVVDGWPPGECDTQAEHFRAHHRKKGDRFVDWQAAWSTWVLNNRKFGNVRHIRQAGQSGVDRRSTLARAIDDGVEWLGAGAQAGFS